MSASGTPPARSVSRDIGDHRHHLPLAGGAAEGDEPLQDLPRLALMGLVLRGGRGGDGQCYNQQKEATQHIHPPVIPAHAGISLFLGQAEGKGKLPPCTEGKHKK